MKAHRHEFPVEKMSKVLGVSRSGYYRWLKQGASVESVEDTLDAKIKKSFERSRRTYGSPRIAQDLNSAQYTVSEATVARRMQRLGLQARKPKRFVVTTQADDSVPAAKNILDRDFEADQLGTKWVSDITYFEVDHQWYYLTVIIDLADRDVVSWVISDNMTAQDTTLAALTRAIQNRKPADQFLFHSDRGVQYSCNDFREKLQSIGATQSMSRKGNCWDNAVAESFFKTIKVECINNYHFKTPQQAWAIIFDYIDGWYSNCRIHTSLGGKTPRQMFQVKSKRKNAA